MDERPESRLDFFQNLTIAILAVSAVVLFSRTEIVQSSWDSAREYFRFTPPQTAGISTPAESSLAASPMRLAATNRYGGRFAALTLTTADAALFRRLLGDALGTSEPLEEVRRPAFLRALEGTSLYCDFLHPLPLGVLAGFMDTFCQNGAEQEVRCAILAAEGEEVALYLWDGGEGYLRRRAPIPPEDLEQTVRRYELGSAFFALDRAPLDALYQNVDPFSLFLEETPRLPIYAAAPGLTGTEQLLTAMRFNPLTNYRYPEANGTEVIVEGGRSLRIRTDGSIYYQSGGQPDLAIECMGELPTPWEAVTGCTSLMESILSRGESAGLYPIEVRQEEETTLLRFGYSLRGIPVCFSDGGCAAVITLERKSVSSLELRSRHYTAGEADSLLLPLPQALGIAGLSPGEELFLGYADNGESHIQAAWLSAAPQAREDTGQE